MEALTLLLCLLLTAFQANTTGSSTTETTIGPLATETTLESLTTEPCGGNMTNFTGEFFSPKYPNNYPNGARCTWTIHSTENMTVSLTFTNVDLESCCDFIRVYDGPSTHYPLQGEIREYRNQAFKSTNNDLTVFFYSDQSVRRTGFHANWVFVESCGGNMTNITGELFSPQYPNNYPNGARCTWTIHSTGNMTVSLTFSNVDLESCCDVIRVYDGPSTHYPLLGEIRDYRNQAFKSINNDLTVFFYSDQSVTRTGFHANWVFVETTLESLTTEPCGGNMTNFTGEFFSPKYPNNYPNGARCTWTIHSTENMTVSLTFTNVDLESCCDVIRVYDGPSTHYPLQGEIREYRNQAFKSTNNDLTVFFYSDQSVRRTGFHANWVFVENTTGPLATESCGGNMTNVTGELFSPQYPNNYPNGARCTWTIHSTGNMTVSLTFSNVDLESCCDVIRVYDGPSTHYPLLGEIRDYRNQAFKSINNDLTVFFYSDQSVTRTGFHANWVFVENTTRPLATENTTRPLATGTTFGPWNTESTTRPLATENTTRPLATETTFGPWNTESTTRPLATENTTRPLATETTFGPWNTESTTRPLATETTFESLTTEHVNCSSDNMVIVIQKSYLDSLGLSADDLYVDDPLCRPNISNTEVVFSFPFDTCGTIKEMKNGYVSYTNNVRASQSQSGEITRQSQFLLCVSCRMEPDTMVQVFYKAKENVNSKITGTGHFGASIAFFTSSSFNQQIYDSPYEVNLNQALYVQVKLNRPDNSLDLFLDTCVASPNPSDFKNQSYDLLRNGCPKYNTYYSYTSGHHYYAQFRFQAFKFLRTHAYVYLQCKVIICPNNDYNSRCHQGCRLRRKRSLGSSTYHNNTVMLGPIKLKGQRSF
ncbi:hypothetical protein QQF64_011010 [Cirrhinus molitorella]|uniref:CUB and zona pellucida-like domain-containing protein 1 n=1 Tax=Cirrhinus molitorella TaxID=172907 RepID=A0ABR3LY16_9TELE